MEPWTDSCLLISALIAVELTDLLLLFILMSSSAHLKPSHFPKKAETAMQTSTVVSLRSRPQSSAHCVQLCFPYRFWTNFLIWKKNRLFSPQPCCLSWSGFINDERAPKVCSRFVSMIETLMSITVLPGAISVQPSSHYFLKVPMNCFEPLHQKLIIGLNAYIRD